jgi:methyl-accepting chemotaxis protein
MVCGIAETSHGQSRLMEQIDGAVRQLESGLQQNSALAEQSAAASENLKVQTAALDEALRCFKLDAKAH